MPRTLDPALLACLERENPSAELFVEITAPNVARVLRRPNDQFLLNPDPQVSLTPASSIVSAPAGGVALASSSTNIVSFLAGGSSPANVDQEDPATRIKGVSWAVDSAFDRAVIRSFTARLRRSSSAIVASFELQVYRASGRWGVLTKADGTQRAFFFWDFVPMLAVPAVVRSGNITWTANVADVVFDLTTSGLVVDGSREGLPSNAFSGQPTYYFSIRRITSAGLGVFTWQADAVTSRVVSGVGTFDQTWWSRTRAGDAWAQQNFGQVPQCSIQVESYNPSGGFAQAVYKIDLGAVPAAGTVGRIRFERSTPPGTASLLELSTTGSGGSYAAVADGDPVAVVQQVYHLRVKWTPSASLRSTPIVSAVGIEFRAPYDVTRESVVAPLSRDVEMPYGAATIGDGEVKVLRTGRRDFADVATMLGSTQPTTKLEVDVFLKSPHPSVTRAKWLRLDRASVQDRIPSETNERFLMLSFLNQLKRKIPLSIETINSVYTVNDVAHGAAANPTALRVYVTPALQGATAGGTEYTSKNYFMRVRASAQVGVQTGTLAVISSHTSAVALNFGAGVLSGVLAYGDTIEVHSGVLAAPVLSYKDWDPALVWKDVLINHLGIPDERIGMGHLPRGGLPPLVTDRAPGDATAQAKYKVSLALEKAEEGITLLDQLSFILGGTTIEIAGQLCFVQLYPLRNGVGDITVPLPTSSRTFDPRDYHSPNFPIGLTQRQSAVTCRYGVDLTVPEALRTAPSQTEVVDADAVLWTGLSASDSRGRSNIPDEIARWCFNSNDSGLLLASELAHQIVQYFGTGRRVWEWSTRDAYRQHHAGDVVTVITDQYSDYDPSGLTPIAGWQAVTVVLLGVSADGRKFRGVVPGVNASTMRRAGGNAGTTNTKPPAADVLRPIPRIDTSSIVEVTAATETVVFSATPGGNSAGPLTYRYRIDLPTGVGSYSAPASFPHGGLAITRLIRRHKIVRLEVTDTSSGLTAETTKVIEGWVPHLDIVTGTVRRDYQLTDGAGTPVGYAAWGDSSDPTGATLPALQLIRDGSQGRNLLRGYQSGFAADGAVITFAPAYSAIPMSLVSPGPGSIISQPNAGSWSPAAYSTTLPVLPDFGSVAKTATSMTIRAKLRQKATATPRNIDFPTNSLTAPGVVSVAVANAPSNNGLYTVRYTYSVTTQGTVTQRTARLTVRVSKRAGGAGGTPTLLSSIVYTAVDPDGSGPYTTSGTAVLSLAATLAAADYLEVEFYSLSSLGSAGSSSAVVHGCINGTDGVYGISFTTAGTADPITSATPDAGDLVFWETWLP